MIYINHCQPKTLGFRNVAVEAPLLPAGDNKLSAKGGFKVTKGTKVVALVELPGKTPFNVRFAVN